MKFTPSFFILAILVSQVLTSSCNFQADSSNVDSVELKISNQNEAIQKLVEEFRGDNGIKTVDITNKIVLLSSQSNGNRQLVIQELLRTVNENTEARTAESYNLWNGAVSTLGELKAVEAINILGDCLDCNNLIGGFVLERYPSAFAITKIGKPAIPKLLELLSQEPEKKESSHFLAAIALSEIYRKEIVEKNERETLRRLIKIEKNKSAKYLIQDILAKIEKDFG